MTDRIALFAPLPAAAVTGALPDAALDVVEIRPGDDAAAGAVGARIAIADWSATVRIAGEVVDALAPTCELVQVPAAGLDSVDVDACRAAGIPVASCAGLNTVGVAEWCVWAAIDALRKLSWSDRALRAGSWEQLGHARYELAGKTVGVVGMGDVGRAVAERLAVFGVDLVYWTRRRRPPEEEARLAVRWAELDDLLAEADIVILAVALTAGTRHLLDAARLTRMKPSAVVVNAARGEVTDEAALAAALREGRLHGAAVDAFSTEPPPPDHPLVGEELAVLTPHVAGATAESVGRILGRVFANLTAVLEGGTPTGLVE
ncbi:MAG: 3-phosphoglycerate dehydrogenase [Actinobacteria bacterium]|nr:3-phosphoglycerate dehydrogenase [Actinomycetota bacterium]